ncbi:vWA domain-containing protein [Burkholderia cenocepacia]|uniref:vWA domain-containing protein n=1 Tax=Burkholderia cenocepacia TaxID=95486 RepID=UPI002ABD7314|nr:VWA-like domain-containing protein [Burkholderia cenocepacia]
MEETNLAAAAFVRITLRRELSFWTEVAYSLTVREATDVPTAATDGRTLFLNRDFFGSKPLDYQVLVVLHELVHKVLLHCTRRGSRDPMLWNIAADFVVNALLKENGFDIPQGWLYDAKYHGWLTESVYADLQKQAEAAQAIGGKGMPQLPEGWQDIHDVDGGAEEVEKYEQEVKALVERATANAKAMGTLPAGIEAGIVEVYKPAREPWFNHLHRFMQALSSSEYNWAKLNRRTLRTHGCFSPLHQNDSLGEVAVFIDTSGSCYDAAMQSNFAGHLNAILSEARPQKVHVYYFDTRVYPGDEIEPGELDVKLRPRGGGGGTSFAGLFNQLEDDGIEPAVSIVLTDLMGTFPAEGPAHPVIWANILDHGAAPFGETIYVEA